MQMQDALDDPVTRIVFENVQTRFLAFDLETHRDEGLWLSQGALQVVDSWLDDQEVQFSPQDALIRAKNWLSACTYFGLVERFQDSLLLWAFEMGLPFPGTLQAQRVTHDAPPNEATVQKIQRPQCGRLGTVPLCIANGSSSDTRTCSPLWRRIAKRRTKVWCPRHCSDINAIR